MNNLEILRAAADSIAERRSLTPEFVDATVGLTMHLLHADPRWTAEQMLRSLIANEMLASEDERTVKRAPALTTPIKRVAAPKIRRNKSVSTMPARAFDAMRTVDCSTCKASVGEPCMTEGGNTVQGGVHAARLEAFAQWIIREREKGIPIELPSAKLPKPKPVRAIDVRCGTCGATPGHPCWEMTSAGAYGTPTDVPRKEGYHRVRYQQAKKGV